VYESVAAPQFKTRGELKSRNRSKATLANSREPWKHLLATRADVAKHLKKVECCVYVGEMIPVALW
jgi:hypothetical protein